MSVVGCLCCRPVTESRAAGNGGFAGQAVNRGLTVPANDLVRASMFINTSSEGPVFDYGEPLSSPSTVQVWHTRKHLVTLCVIAGW